MRWTRHNREHDIYQGTLFNRSKGEEDRGTLEFNRSKGEVGRGTLGFSQ